MAQNFFAFPNPVNDVASRTVAAGVVVLVALTLGTRQLWLTVPLAYGFAARVATGPRLSPLGRVATQLVAPRLKRLATYSPGPPKRFAQGLGLCFSIGAMACWLAGERTAAFATLAVLLVPALLESALGLCVGCQLFRMMIRFGWIPEAVCEECADIWSARARRIGTTAP